MEFLEDASDARLKPRLLRSLVRDRLPDEKRSLPSPSQLSSILSLLRTHDLLSESLPDPAAGTATGKLATAWGAAVDAWVERCLALSSSKMPDKRWAGVCLLGLTCEMCSDDRFLRSYQVWYQALVSNIQPPGDSRLVKLVSCTSISDLLTRLSNFASVKKDATSLASKLSQPVLQLLNDDDTDAVLVGALGLLGTLLSLFPFSIRRHYEKTESVIISKIMSDKYDAAVSEKLANCLALLLKAKADEDSWVTMLDRILMSINNYLTSAFRGLEEETRSADFMKMMASPGKDPPSPFEGHSLSLVGPQKAINECRELQVTKLYALMRCCCAMITISNPVQVSRSVQILISQVERVLVVDGSLPETYANFTSELHQEFICSVLPCLHLSSLDLLTSVIKALRSQLLPYAASVTRILKEYFKRATLPCLRIKVYSIMQILLTSMGVGMAYYLAEEIIHNAVADLVPLSSDSSFESLSSKAKGECTLHHSSKKRKYASQRLKEQVVTDTGKETVSRKMSAPLSVQIAALNTLEALVTVAGSLKAECWRQDVDRLLVTVASNACSAGLASDIKSSIPEWGSLSSRTDVQLASLQALLASLLSHGYIRPPYLSQGFELFRRGKLEIGTNIAAFCTHALLALEVLIHPRSLPLAESSVTKCSGYEMPSHSSYTMFPCGQKSRLLAFSRDTDHALNGLRTSGDDIYDKWLGKREKTAIDVANDNAHTENDDLSDRPIEKPSPEMAPVTSFDQHQVTEGNFNPSCADDMDENADKPRENGEQVLMDLGNVPATNKTPPFASTSGLSCDSIEPGINHAENQGDTHKDVEIQDSPLPNRAKELCFDSDSPSLDSLPDIVDADPDSESSS